MTEQASVCRDYDSVCGAPDRLDAEFVNERNERERPVMIHHAVLDSMERRAGRRYV
ncbi:hypothetical protein [Paraburkholderia sp. SIMBA_030]|uniref:hypothetical protein n=1 Tax=Paraburkholderia sp. SIMBA_030 TaxID=3085773 RepID=UPI00397A1C0C